MPGRYYTGENSNYGASSGGWLATVKRRGDRNLSPSRHGCWLRGVAEGPLSLFTSRRNGAVPCPLAVEDVPPTATNGVGPLRTVGTLTSVCSNRALPSH